MNFLIWLFFLHLRLIYFLMKLFPTKNKIVFISRLSNEPSIDYKYLVKELKKDSNFEIIILCKKMENYLMYYLHFYRQMFELATSKVCVVDSYIPMVSMLKHKKSLKILQLWHSLGAIKKFGLQNLNLDSGRNEKLSKVMKMHQNYTNIITTSMETTKYFSKAFGYNRDKFLNYGLPRIDYLLQQEKAIKEKIYSKYSSLKNKKTILYAPTFRRNKIDKTEEILKMIDYNKYNIIFKSHPLHKININNDKVYKCSEFKAMDLIAVSDIVITDYSAISLEAMILNKKLFLYLFDYNEYKNKTGLNVNLEKEMSNYTFETKKEFQKLINKEYSYSQYKQFKSKYIENTKGNSTKLIIGKIREWMC